MQVVGFFLMPTRQLDMIMADRAAFAHYGEKIRADLAQFKYQGLIICIAPPPAPEPHTRRQPR